MHIERPDDINLLLLTKDSPMRGEVEYFSKTIYRRFYGAELTSFPDELLALTYKGRGVVSCIGIKAASASELYLEQYLGARVDEEIAALTGRKVSREEIVEIGTLAIRSKSTCRMIISALAGLLVQRKKKYLVFTAVRTLRNTLTNLEVPFTTLATASASQVKDNAKWGNYYSASPEVILVDIESCQGALKKLMHNASTTITAQRKIAAQIRVKAQTRLIRRAMKQLFLKGLTIEEPFIEETCANDIIQHAEGF